MKSPGHRDHPEHKVLQKAVHGKMRAQLGADVLAESSSVIEVDEDQNPPRFYFPRGDVRMDRLAPSETRTYCPFKGEASYFSMELGDGPLPDAHADLKGRVAFYSEKFDGLQFKID
jgi:uncharacterized protein (DUF427 family)